MSNSWKISIPQNNSAYWVSLICYDPGFGAFNSVFLKLNMF